jgi:hypothetical protein
MANNNKIESIFDQVLEDKKNAEIEITNNTPLEVNDNTPSEVETNKEEPNKEEVTNAEPTQENNLIESNKEAQTSPTLLDFLRKLFSCGISKKIE